jgi:hypothetical protein
MSAFSQQNAKHFARNMRSKDKLGYNFASQWEVNSGHCENSTGNHPYFTDTNSRDEFRRQFKTKINIGISVMQGVQIFQMLVIISCEGNVIPASS